MKIVMLADTLHIGGAETHLFELSRLLASRGHEVTVLSAGGATADRLAAVGVTHRLLPDAVNPAVARTLADVIREIKPHAVHAHTRRRAFLCRMALAELDFPAVFTAHALLSPRFPLDRLSFFPADVIAVSPDIADHLRRRFGVPESHVTVIENGVDTERFRPADATRRGFTILSVSRQDRDCALAATLLCRLAPLLQERLGRSIRIDIAGGGNALPVLRELARHANAACGREAVTLLGNVEDTAPLYRDCDLFVGVSRAAMEAMASEKPVILCGNEGYLGILDEAAFPTAAATNLCARGAEAASPERLLSDLTTLAEASPEERAALGRFGRDVVCRHYSADLMAERTLAVYRRALERFREGRHTDAVLCGYYGYGNCGDELILRHIVAAQKARRDTVRLGVMTADGNAPEGTVGIRRYRMPEVLRALRHSGALILGGGSLLQDATSRRSLLYYLSLIRVANRMGLPVMLYANGLGPLSPSALRLCGRAFRGVDVISLRDRDSWETVRAMALPRTRVLLGADPVLDGSPSLDAASPRLPRIAVFPKGGADRAEEQALADSVAALALVKRWSVAVAAMNPREDRGAVRRMTERLAAHLSGSGLHVAEASSDPEAITRLVGHSSLVIGERLHALILAFREGVPSVGIDRDPKIGAFLREIGRRPSLCDIVSPQSMISCADFAIHSPRDPILTKALTARARADADTAYALIAREEIKF